MNTPRPLRIGIVGLNFGRHILEQLKLDAVRRDFELAAVCDLDAAKAADYAGRYSVKAYSSLHDLLADPSIPAIGLFTGPVGRAQIIRKIMQAGKDIITTKPFSVSNKALIEFTVPFS